MTEIEGVGGLSLLLAISINLSITRKYRLHSGLSSMRALESKQTVSAGKRQITSYLGGLPNVTMICLGP